MAAFHYWLWIATFLAAWRPLQVVAGTVFAAAFAITAWDQRHRRPSADLRSRPRRVAAWVEYLGTALAWAALCAFGVLAAAPSLLVLVVASTRALIALTGAW